MNSLKEGSFYLLPAYEHQKKEPLKEEYGRLVDETLAAWSPDARAVTIDCSFAAQIDDIRRALHG